MALDLINRYAKAKFNDGTDNNLEPPNEFVQSLANDLESLKEFVQNTAFDIDGLEAHDPDEEIDVHGALGSVKTYWKNFTAGWKMKHEPIHPKFITQIRTACLSTHYMIML
jgi:hypothetical protein